MTHRGAPVEILMAAYDGAAYIEAQIDSVLGQTDPGWHLVIRDDCSTDDTYRVALACAARAPGRIEVSRRAGNSGSAKQNFLEMLQASRADYVMFCDDDDVWIEDKVAVLMGRIRALEELHGTGTPLLVHSDLAVVDRDLRPVAGSLIALQRLAGDETRLHRMLAQNAVTGCTVVVNRALAGLVVEPFDDIVMHDWWLALIASAFGHLELVPRPTVRYRQHTGNAVGARRTGSPRYLLRRLGRRRAAAGELRATATQAAAFLRCYRDLLSAEQAETLVAYAGLPDLPWWARVRTLARHDFWKSTLVRRVGQVLSL